MENEQITAIRTIKYEGLESVCEIHCGNGDWYYFGSRIVKSSADLRLAEYVGFSQVPEPVQREYLLWRLSKGGRS